MPYKDRKSSRLELASDLVKGAVILAFGIVVAVVLAAAVYASIETYFSPFSKCLRAYEDRPAPAPIVICTKYLKVR